MELIVAIVASTIRHLIDPPEWVLIAGCAYIGYKNLGWGWVLAGTLAFTILNLMYISAYGYISSTDGRIVLIFLSHTIIGFAAFGIGTFIRKRSPGEERRPEHEKIVAAIIPQIQQTIATFTHLRGEPTGLWKDPFVLGYVGGLAGCIAKAATSGSISAEEMGNVLRDVLVGASKGQPDATLETYLSYSGHPDLKKGMRASYKIFTYTYEIMENEDEDKDVQAAKKIASGTLLPGQKFDRIAISGALQYMLFNQELRQRFSATK